MMRHALILLLLLAPFPAFGHPPVSVVIDGAGNVYYSDLEQVWRIAPDGKKSVAVPGVHTHELALDPDGTLYGEHLWYNGERLNTWGYYVWKRSPQGTITKVIPSTPGFRQNYSFVRDRAGNMYWAERERNEIRRRTPEGRIEMVARGKFRDVRWMTVTPDGVVYFIDTTDLLRATKDRIVTVARQLSSRPFLTRAFMGERHLVMGIWTDSRGNVYVADTGHGVVKRVTSAGQVSVVDESPIPWAVCGGTIAPNGDLWLLETRVGNAIRVRKAGRVR